MKSWYRPLYAMPNKTLSTIQVTYKQGQALLQGMYRHPSLKSLLSLVAEMKMNKRKQNLQLSNQLSQVTLLCRLSTFKMKIMKNLRVKPLK
jgi:hypothetical protein